MYKDSYVEQVVKSKTPFVFIVRIGFAIFLILFGFLMLFIPNRFLSFAFMMMGAVFIFMVKDERKVEYEYSFTNNHVEVAVVYNGAKRRELRGFDLDVISVIVPGTSKRFQGIPGLNRYDYTSGKKDADTVLFYMEQGNKKYLFMLEPNEEIMEHIKMFAKDKLSEF